MAHLALVAVVVAAAAIARLSFARRAGRRGRIAPRFGAMPAGVKQLAALVSEVSDPGLRLPTARTLGRRRRLGGLLSLR